MSARSRKSSYEHDDIKGSSSKMKQHDDYDEPQDYEKYSKKDLPPRFSTIFDTKPQPILAEPMVEAPRRRRRDGVFIPLPIFILLATLFLLESIVLFAYTAIGLYNQLPGSRTVPLGHSSTAAACDLAAPVRDQPAINISPNFVVGGAGNQPTVTETVTFLGRQPMSEVLQLSSSSVSSSSTTTSSSSSTTSTSTSSTTSTSTSSTISIAVVTYTPPGGTLTSVIFVTASAESRSPPQRPTSFVTVFAGASLASESSNTISLSASAAAKDRSADVSSTTSSSSSSTTSSQTSTSSTSTTTSSSTTSTPPPPPPPTTTTTSTTSPPAPKATHKACIGGAGAVALDCL